MSGQPQIRPPDWSSSVDPLRRCPPKKKGARGGRRIRGSKRCSNERKKKRKTAGRITWPRGSQWQGGKWGAAVCVTSGSSRHCVHRSVGRHRNLIHHCVAFFRLFFILWRWWPFSFSFSYPKCFFLGFFFSQFFFRSVVGGKCQPRRVRHSFIRRRRRRRRRWRCRRTTSTNGSVGFGLFFFLFLCCFFFWLSTSHSTGTVVIIGFYKISPGFDWLSHNVI